MACHPHLRQPYSPHVGDTHLFAPVAKPLGHLSLQVLHRLAVVHVQHQRGSQPLGQLSSKDALSPRGGGVPWALIGMAVRMACPVVQKEQEQEQESLEVGC